MSPAITDHVPQTSMLLHVLLPFVSAASIALFLFFCMSCKRKKTLTSHNNGSHNPTLDQQEGNFHSVYANNDVVDYSISGPPPSASPAAAAAAVVISLPATITIGDNSLRIKSTAVHRALPDIPFSASTNHINGSPIAGNSSTANDSNNLLGNTSQLMVPLNMPTTAVNSVSLSTTPPISLINPSSSSPANNSVTSSLGNVTTVNLADTSVRNNTVYHGSPSILHQINGSNKETSSIETTLTPQTSKSKHHSYARIRDNNVVDSSTENDTDDYCDPRAMPTKLFESKNHTITIAVNLNSSSSSASQPNIIDQPSTSSGLYAVSVIPALERSSFHMPQSSHHVGQAINRVPMGKTIKNDGDDNGADNDDDDGDDDEYDEEPAKEVSYNKISVREPLAKVLAERAIMEHHYTEVYEENNSFYEEIPGSTNSSVTYTKIGDIGPESRNSSICQPGEMSQILSQACRPSTSRPQRRNDSNEEINIVDSEAFVQLAPPVTPPPPPPVDNMLSISHGSRSTSPAFMNPSNHFLMPVSTSILMPSTASSSNVGSGGSSSQLTPAQLNELYTVVNKSAKTSNKKVAHDNFNDLYAKVQKCSRPNRDTNHSVCSALTPIKMNVEYGGASSIRNAALPLDSIVCNANQAAPPPLPPLDNIPRSCRTVSMYSAIPDKLCSSSSSSIMTNGSFSTCNQSPTVSISHAHLHSSPQNLPSSGRSALHHKRSQSTGNHHHCSVYGLENDDEPIEDPGYEVVEPSSSSNHNYEKINRPENGLSANKKSYLNGRADQNRSSSSSSSNSNPRSRSEEGDDEDDDDCLVEPGYEIVHYAGNRNQTRNLDSDEDSPCYETIHKQSDCRNGEPLSEPDYEVIPAATSSGVSRQFEVCKPRKLPIIRAESDVSNEPGYERIRYVPKKQQSDETMDDTYASIARPSPPACQDKLNDRL